MDSRRFVVSAAASYLLSWRLAVFILRGGGLVYLSRGVLGGCPWLGCGLCEDWLPHSWWGSVRAARVASTATGADLWAAAFA